MPADDPDQTTGAVRGRRASGRHRTDRPDEPPQTPEVGFPAAHKPDPAPSRPRHARGGEPATRRTGPRTHGALDEPGWGAGGWGEAGRNGASQNDASRTDTGWNGARDRGAWTDTRNGDPYGAAGTHDSRDGHERDGPAPDSAAPNGRDRTAEDPDSGRSGRSRRRAATAFDTPAREAARPEDAYPDAPHSGGRRADRDAPGGYRHDPYAADRYPADPHPAPHPADPHPSDPYTADPHPAAPHPTDPHPAAPHPADQYPAAPHPADQYPADPYPADQYPADQYPAAPHPADQYPADQYPADQYPAAPHPADQYPAAPHPADQYPADPYPADQYPAAPYPADAYPADPHAAGAYVGDPYGERPADPAAPDRGRATRRGAAANGAAAGSPAGAHDRFRGPEQEDALAADPAAEIDPDIEPAADPEPDAGSKADREPAGPPPDRPTRPRVQGLPRGPGRAHAGPAPAAAMPSRRPGDPPGAPAELFVETTAETPALTPELLDRHERARASAAAEPDPAADDDPPSRPRVFGVPLPALPAWADRLTRRTGEDGSAGAHGHGHGHGPPRPAGRRVRILIAALLVPCALATLVGLALLWPVGGPPDTARPGSQQPVQAAVTAITAADCSPGSGSGGCVALVVHMADGPRPGRDLVQVVPLEPGTPTFAVGDRVVLSWSGADADDAGSYQIVDFQRDGPLVWLAALFAVAVLVLGRWRGLAALVALGLSFVVLLYFVVPAILAGRDPLAVAVVGACLIMFAVLYLTHGPSARTSTAVLGTLLSLALIGALGAGFSAAARLTGLDDQTSNLIATLGTGVDARGLLLAGVVIGALGVLDDVTVTQTSAVWELRHANPELSARRLFTAAMRIGRDHVASAVNTLVLAYAGAALPLLLLFALSGRGFGDVVTSQDVATEIVRTLVGSIGLVASVPITTALAAAVAARETVPAEQTG